jgi:DNA primase
LEKTGLQVKVLQMRDAKDPDEFLKKFGADKFKLLLEESSNRVEYQLQAIRRKYDIREDDQRVKYVQEAAQLLCSLNSDVQREVYGRRVAEAAGISFEAIKLEIQKAAKRRYQREKKKQEQIDLSPARNHQPRAKSIRYDNIKSAMAEEAVLALILKEPALLDKTAELTPESFSSPLLGRAYGQLKDRYRQGMDVSLAVLSEFSGEEMSHLAGILQRQDGPVSEDALSDCIRTIRGEQVKKQVSSDEDLLALRNKLKERKGMKS